MEMVCAILCAGLYPNVIQCKRRGKQMAFYTKEVGQVVIHPASVNAGVHLFPLPYMVYSEKTSTGASVLTNLVFWFILVPMLAGKQFEVTLLIGCIYSVNAIFLALDSLVNTLPFDWFGFTYFVLWSATRHIPVDLHACGVTWWPYPFLEL